MPERFPLHGWVRVRETIAERYIGDCGSARVPESCLLSVRDTASNDPGLVLDPCVACGISATCHSALKSSVPVQSESRPDRHGRSPAHALALQSITACTEASRMEVIRVSLAVLVAISASSSGPSVISRCRDRCVHTAGNRDRLKQRRCYRNTATPCPPTQGARLGFPVGRLA